MGLLGLKYDPDFKVPLSIDLRDCATGEVFKCPCTKERFNCLQFLIPNKKFTMKYQEMRGWVILESLARIILYFRPYCVVEIGCGVSTLVLAKIAEEVGVKLYSCDKKEAKCQVCHENHIFFNGLSSDFMKDFDDTPAIVLIDADHHYEVAKTEFDFFFEKLVPGGVIFLHDTLPPHEAYLRPTACADVYKLRQELEQRTDEMDCFTWPYTAGYMGLTMVIKKDKDRPYWGK